MKIKNIELIKINEKYYLCNIDKSKKIKSIKTFLTFENENNFKDFVELLLKMKDETNVENLTYKLTTKK